VGFNTYTDATLKLGECTPASAAPGASCMAQVTLRPGSEQQNRTIGFAQVGGQWKSRFGRASGTGRAPRLGKPAIRVDEAL
jgi:hypothetical protein